MKIKKGIENSSWKDEYKENFTIYSFNHEGHILAYYSLQL